MVGADKMIMCMVLLLICMVIGLIVANTLGFNPGEDLFTPDCSQDYNKALKECLEAQSELEDQAAQGGDGDSTSTSGGSGATGAGNSTRREYKETASPFFGDELYFPHGTRTPEGKSQPVAESVARVLRLGGRKGGDSSALIDAGSVSEGQHGTESGKSVKSLVEFRIWCPDRRRCGACVRACVRASFLHHFSACGVSLRVLTQDVVRRRRQWLGGDGGSGCGDRLVGPSSRCRYEQGRGTAVSLAAHGTRRAPRGWRIGWEGGRAEERTSSAPGSNTFSSPRFRKISAVGL